MAHDYFYAPPSRISATEILIDGEEHRHLARVLRKNEGDEIVVVDGAGNVYTAAIRLLSRTAARCEILGRHPGETESPVAVTLGVGMLKNPSKFDFLVEKATELGVRAIIPLQTARTIAQHGKADRWQKLALAAMKQAGRSLLPNVGPAATLTEFLLSAPAAALRLLAHEREDVPLLPRVMRHQDRSAVSLCIGPEGGFTDEETAEAAAAGFQLVSLGPRRLRTETAAVVATAFCTLAGDRPAPSG